GVPIPLVRVSLGETLASFVGGGIGGGAGADTEGWFRIAGIRPGRYILSARDSKGLTGELPLETAGADVHGLEIVIGPGAKIAGRRSPVRRHGRASPRPTIPSSSFRRTARRRVPCRGSCGRIARITKARFESPAFHRATGSSRWSTSSRTANGSIQTISTRCA